MKLKKKMQEYFYVLFDYDFYYNSKFINYNSLFNLVFPSKISKKAVCRHKSWRNSSVIFKSSCWSGYLELKTPAMRSQKKATKAIKAVRNKKHLTMVYHSLSLSSLRSLSFDSLCLNWCSYGKNPVIATMQKNEYSRKETSKSFASPIRVVSWR